QAKLAAFEQKMLGIVNNQATGLLVSVGHQVGLFDAMARVGPATSEQIASASKLNERYVREWLGGMVVSHIVEYDPTTATYVLPAEHAARTTGPAALNNMARATEKITALSHLDQGIVESFRNGGGVPYAAFSRLRLQQRTDPDDPAALFGSV